VSELAHEGPAIVVSASHVVALDDNNAARDCPAVEGGSERGEVRLQGLVVPLAFLGLEEREIGCKVVVDLLLVLPVRLLLADAD